MNLDRERLAELVDDEGGIVQRALFVAPGIYQAELQRIFPRTWLLVGHESQIPEPEDFVVSRMGTDSVILTRNKQGEILVFLNSCPHRGMRVCRYDAGNTRVFTCPYHGWSFSTDRERVREPGAIVGLPRAEEGYGNSLDRQEWGLARCPRVTNYKGTVWANWDADAVGLEDYLGDMRFYLDAVLDHRDGRPGGSMVLAGVQKWRVESNWKLAAENFIGDLYHEISHQSADLAKIGPSGGKGRRDSQRPRLAIGFPALGHGVLGYTPYYEEQPYSPTWTNHPEVEAYFKAVYEARVANLGDAMRVHCSVGTIFPNLSFHANQPRGFLVTHPIGPTTMEMWRYYLVDADAPDHVKAALRAYALRYSGPGGMTEQDDMENWTEATQASAGSIARTRAYNYQLGLGKERAVPGLTGAIQSGSYSEANARLFYRRWREFMEERSWDALMAAAGADETRMAAHGD